MRALALFAAGIVAQKRLLEFNETHRAWHSPEEVDQLIQQEVHFMDVTDHVGWYDRLRRNNQTAQQTSTFPTQLQFQDLVKSVLPYIDPNGIATSITQLSSYKTRYYTTQTGADAVEWLLGQYRYFLQRCNQRISLDKLQALARMCPLSLCSTRGCNPR